MNILYKYITKEEVFFMERVLTTEERIRRAEEIYRKSYNPNISMFKYILYFLFFSKCRKFIFKRYA